MDDQRLAIVNAMDATLRLARQAGLDNLNSDTEHADYPHLQSLYDKSLEAIENGDPSFTEGKLNRWLGWMQGCVYCQAGGDIQMDGFREVNKAEEVA